jgi:ribonuclease D
LISGRPKPTEPQEPPILVEDAESFGRLMRELERAQEIAFDTEADSFYSYQERVCLIQITAAEVDYLVDPLQGFDISALGDVLADREKTKVFHDGEYDVLILKRDFGFDFASLFDTRVAAAALGQETPGLAAVVQERFGLELDKSQQRSDWSRRPLSHEQIAYARLDTRYLLPLMHVLREELEERGRTRVVSGECRRLEALDPVVRSFNPDEFIRIKGARGLEPLEMQVLRELTIWRDREARQRNVPPFKVLGNKPILDIARARPRSQRRLEDVHGLSPKVARRLGRALLDVVRRAEERGPLTRAPRLPAKDGTGQLDEAGIELHDRLKTWRKERATEEGFDASLILNRHTLVNVAAIRPTTVAELAEVEGLLDWQVEFFAGELVELVRTFEDDLAAGRFTPTGRRGRRRR